MGVSIIVALSFGKPADISSNNAISLIARKIAEYFDAKIISDRSIVFPGRKVESIGPPAEVHESTYNFAIQIANMVNERRGLYRQVIVVSAPLYMFRVIRDIEVAMREKNVEVPIRDWRDFRDLIIPKVVEEKFNWYDCKSSQLWTKFRWLFVLREMILVGMPFWLYKKLST